MENSEPFEIIAAPFTLYIAPVGTAFPDVADAPAGGWTKVGTSGDQNYDEEGVTVQHNQEIVKWRALGGTGPRKAFRPSEDLMIRLALADLSAAQFAMVMNGNTVTSVPGGVGEAPYKKVGLTRGLGVQRRALLVRGGVSPEGEGWSMQYEIPVAILESSQEVTFKKDDPAKLQLEWSALEDPDAASEDERFGRLVVQSDDPNT